MLKEILYIKMSNEAPYKLYAAQVMFDGRFDA